MKQPKALYLLNFVSMWEYFSYYGMRALLVLFLIEKMHLNDLEAFSLYALYTTLLELGGIAGGLIADRLLGLKRSVSIGGWVIAAGHICLAIPSLESTFFLGLGLIVVGTSLFRSNAAMLLGVYYEENDPRREAGYRLYYTGINIGGFLAAVCCGIVGEVYGWHAGFSLAALGMLLGNIALVAGRKLLKGRGELLSPVRKNRFWTPLCLSITAPAVALALYYHSFVTPFLPVMALLGIVYALKRAKQFTSLEKANLGRLGLYVLCLILFYACEEQLGSSLTLFAERHVDRHTWLGVLPTSSLLTFNTLTILMAGPWLSRWLQRLPWRGFSLIGVSFLLLALSFCTLYVGCIGNSVVPLLYVVTAFVAMALGELFIAPTVYAYASQIAPQRAQGFVMGIVTMGFALANLLSGVISRLMAADIQENSLEIYMRGFGTIGAPLIGLGIVVLLLSFSKKRAAEQNIK